MRRGRGIFADIGLHGELVRRGGLADAIYLRGIEGIEFPFAVALLLRAVPGSSKGKCRPLLQGRLTFDLGAESDPAGPAAQDAQLPLMPLELLGLSVTACHHRRRIAEARRRAVSPGD